MRILMLGAGGIGGYFGARMHQAGGDVTFLVRPARAAKLAADGLRVVSPLGDVHITPKVVTTVGGPMSGHFDIVVLSCKAYDLDAALDSIAPALSPEGVVLPLLNGFAHLSRLDAQFGQERVLGGLAHLSVTLAPTGEIRHLNQLHRLLIGSRKTPASPLLRPLAELLAQTGIDFSLSENIEGDMWDKFIFLSTLAGATCTMRSSIGDILETHSGEAFIIGLLDECVAVAAQHGHIPSAEQLTAYRNQLTARGSGTSASMLRDIERGGATEADHILGDMVCRAETHGVDAPLLKLAYSHLQAYEIRRRLINLQQRTES
ncbi:2-dehydropantoate 2-reductase [Pseudogulbenkiania subflava]|uniref:2-dehydropantoate 2-reductase n=1 Tax=Pseudogulbenkiania subflava DSM 22618 TaxID=1123014 RepID=A0A1Y6BYC0_9NEIS|nr:2-dehydropantoate 2-reductase [Pseudogulbenkiania subflava]SMF31530.1 2-dehydropantoate 2-reductase [Pseudogulbenkiania subflava DSM 22618]